MEFYIEKIILWPKNTDLEPRQISFKKGKVNVITGDSERGKSALIALVDYAMCSSKCQIPVGIREYVEWFGVLFSINSRKMLLARREPGIHQANGDMYKREFEKAVIIPNILKKNTSVDAVKLRLDEIAGLSDLAVNDNEEGSSGFGGRPSFRDMASFLFQPQYIIANQSTLLYKTDSYQHREKIRNIFPYVLQAIDNETLRNKERLKELHREQNALEKEYTSIQKGVERWLGEIRGTYMKAKEYGLLTNRPFPDDDWTAKEFISNLKNIPRALDKKGAPTLPEGTTEKITSRIAGLKDQEIELSRRLEELRHKQATIKRIANTNEQYSKSILTQNERLKTVGWFNKKIKEHADCPVCGSTPKNNQSYINALLRVGDDLRERSAQANDTKVIFDSEIVKVGNQIKVIERKINNIRQELKQLEYEDGKYKNRGQTINDIYRFVGSLESKLASYNILTDDGDLVKKLNQLSKEILELEEKVDSSLIRQKEKTALDRIQSSISHYSKLFQAERSDDPIKLNTADLTLDFSTDKGRVDALWEIGSGSNYMAYHVSALLALHELFLRYSNHPVPSFIFFDQPSQAYFPELQVNEESMSQAKQGDVERVKRIFKVLSDAIKRTQGKLQIIVLEHAGPSFWENFADVHKVARWRDDEKEKALIPDEWKNSFNISD
ncbi:MAG: hypothetical protein CL843_04600 [Crocinitomicaceae bacterium]|nr:hypothetical protein [Crocinitomicaceae bacterium]|tara:strand:+ start:4679 stop:6682 length:2004 start_codon:yes stop_codon:yes gene_type:complete